MPWLKALFVSPLQVDTLQYSCLLPKDRPTQTGSNHFAILYMASIKPDIGVDLSCPSDQFISVLKVCDAPLGICTSVRCWCYPSMVSSSVRCVLQNVRGRAVTTL